MTLNKSPAFILKTHWAPTDQDDFTLNFHYYDATADMPGGLTQKSRLAVPCHGLNLPILMILF